MEGDTHTSFLKNNILFLFISYRLMDYFLYMQLTINFFLTVTNFHCIHQSYTSNFGIILLCVWCNPCVFGGELAGRLHQQVLQNAIWRRSKQHVNYRKKHLFTCISHLVCFTPCRVWPRCTVISCFMKTCCRIFLQTNKLYLLYTEESYIVSDGLSEQYGKCTCTNILY